MLSGPLGRFDIGWQSGPDQGAAQHVGQMRKPRQPLQQPQGRRALFTGILKDARDPAATQGFFKLSPFQRIPGGPQHPLLFVKILQFRV